MEFRKRKKRLKAAISVASRRSVGLSGSKYGAADGTRTADPLLVRQMLSQLS